MEHYRSEWYLGNIHKRRRSGKEEIAVGAMVVHRVNAASEWRVLEVGWVKWVKWQFADGDGLKRWDSGHESDVGQETTRKQGLGIPLQKWGG